MGLVELVFQSSIPDVLKKNILKQRITGKGPLIWCVLISMLSDTLTVLLERTLCAAKRGDTT